jgi:23S rRNA (cytosine1962-C5)-methyltransferase
VIADALLAATGCSRLYERSDSGVRGLEGLELRSGWLRGDGATESPSPSTAGA